MKLKRLILGLLAIVVLSGFIGCTDEDAKGIRKVKPNKNKYVDIYDVVKEAFITDKGYTDDIAKHMTKEVFDKTNAYKSYPVHKLEYIRPFRIEISLKQVAQHKDNEKVIVDMKYSIKVIDSANKIVGGSGGDSADIPIRFTVEKRNSDWVVVEKVEDPFEDH